MSQYTFQSPTTRLIAAFLSGIGLRVRAGSVPDAAFLPGLYIDDGAIVVDEDRLLYPGDLLHEAGHLAVVPPSRRSAMTATAGDDPAEEMMAIAWSYAALMHLGLPATVLFHEAGYKGGAQALIDNFTQGRTVGVPMLQWIGLTRDAERAAAEGVAPYPHMVRWLREEGSDDGERNAS